MGKRLTKRKAETAERIVCAMTEREYWALVGWLGDGMRDPLWEYVRPFRAKQQPDQTGESAMNGDNAA